MTQCLQCGAWDDVAHQHLSDQTGLDDGVPIKGRFRKKMTPKPAEVMAEIRKRAWATRRAKYGSHGHG
jgi:hypothetical protein